MPTPTTPQEAAHQSETLLFELTTRIEEGDREGALIFAELVREKMDKLIEMLEG